MNMSRTCWGIVPKVQMLLIRCKLGVRRFRSMISMGDFVGGVR